jgi:pilus assembly protein CpaC
MTRKVRRLPILTMSAAILFAASAASAIAAPQPYIPSSGAPMRVTTQSAPVRTQVLNLAKGRSAVIDLPADASDVFVSNPAVADAVLRTPRRIFVLGVAAGQSDAIFFDGMGRQILNLSVHVEAPTDNLADAMHRLFPESHVEVQSLNGHIVLSGMAKNAGDADEMARLAQTYVEKPEDVLNLISIAGKDQVTLKVRIVEVNRNTIKQLGFDKSALIGQFGGVQYSLAQSPTYGVNNKLLGGMTGGYTLDTTKQPQMQVPCSDPSLSNCYDVIHGPANTGGADNYKTATYRDSVGSDGLNKANAMIQAFEQVGLVRTLAEPNLTAVSGESARFLAGGEFPVPVGQDNQGRVTVEFKPFGVGLGFTPVVTSSGRISLKVSTEVSELTNVGALSLSSSLTIPGLTVRRAETSVEMQSGSSLMIAGLLQSKYKQAIGSLPGLTTLPVLGTLFRSRDFLNDETEMVVIVTPYIVAPTDPNALQTPADNLHPADDLSTVFMGNLNRVIHKPVDGQAPPPAAPYQAPIGYVIE